MKFLLKQKLNYEKVGFIYHLFPNQFSSDIVKQAKKSSLILDINYKWNGKYCNVQSYLILENDFKRLKAIFKKRIIEKRNRFHQQAHLIQLIQILKYIFQRNNRAKENSKYSAIQKAYNDKQEFLDLALDIAKKMTNLVMDGKRIQANHITHIFIIFKLGPNKYRSITIN